MTPQPESSPDIRELEDFKTWSREEQFLYVRRKMAATIGLILAIEPTNRELAIARTRLEEALMWFIASSAY